LLKKYGNKITKSKSKPGLKEEVNNVRKNRDTSCKKKKKKKKERKKERKNLCPL